MENTVWTNSTIGSTSWTSNINIGATLVDDLICLVDDLVIQIDGYDPTKYSPIENINQTVWA